MRWNKIGFWFAHIVVLAYCGVLLAAFGMQFIGKEFPCPLCILQRMAMMLVCLGPVYIIAKAKYGAVSMRDFTTGYGMSLVAAVLGVLMSSRQVLLHIAPGDPGYGSPVLGLHLYTWALITFLVVIVYCGLSLIFAKELLPGAVAFGWLSKLTLGLFLLIIAANMIAVFFEAGFHWYLPDNPTKYELVQ